MSKIKYYLRRIRNLNRGKFKETFDKIKVKSGKGTIPLAVDMLWCALRYGAGYTDYEFSAWWTLNGKQRKTYLTRGINDSLVKKVNDPTYYHFLDNKAESFDLFAEYMGRGHLDLTKTDEKDFEAFMENRELIIAKPLSECCGIGVEKLKKSDFPTVHDMYEHIKSASGELVEDYIVQHPAISAIYPGSVNTIRMVSIISDDGAPHILYAAIRIGRGGSVVDNLKAGGMGAPIDLGTGKINGVAYGRMDCEVYETHPDTGVKLYGYQIPMWEEAKELVLKAAVKIPQIRYIGWDVAITENGPTFVEANQHPGYGFIQYPANTPDKIGYLPEFRKYFKT